MASATTPIPPQQVGSLWCLPYPIVASGLGGLLAGIDHGTAAASCMPGTKGKTLEQMEGFAAGMQG